MNEVSEILSPKENENDMIGDFRPPPDVTDLATVLKTEENSAQKQFVVRKGTSADVFNESGENEQIYRGKPTNKLLERHKNSILCIQEL